MNKNDIFMIRGTDYKAMTVRILDEIKLADDIGDRKKRVALKPNLVVARQASSGATTHPEIVDGVLTYLQQNGFENLVVMEGSWVGDRTSQAVRVSGIWDACQKHGVEFIDLQQDSFVSKDAQGMEIKVCSEAEKVDYMINLPALKGHGQTVVTCALKNGKGLMPNSEKRRFHTLGLHRPIAHLNTVIRQDLILVDNICGDLDFEEGGNPVYMNRILAFKDPVLCDSFVAESMGYAPYDIEYIELAEKLGVGSSDTSKAVITDLTEGDFVAVDAKPSGRVKRLAAYVDAKDACSACYGSLIYALDRLDDRDALSDKAHASIGIGQGFKGQKGGLGIGSCTHCFNRSLQGCPPKASEIVDFLEHNWK